MFLKERYDKNKKPQKKHKTYVLETKTLLLNKKTSFNVEQINPLYKLQNFCM